MQTQLVIESVERIEDTIESLRESLAAWEAAEAERMQAHIQFCRVVQETLERIATL